MRYFVGPMEVSDELYHHGIEGMEWHKRRFQYKNGKYTPAGKLRYGIGLGEAISKIGNWVDNNITGASASTNARNIERVIRNATGPVPYQLRDVERQQKQKANNALYGRAANAAAGLVGKGIGAAFDIRDGVNRYKAKNTVKNALNEMPKNASNAVTSKVIANAVGKVVNDKDLQYYAKELSKPDLDPAMAYDIRKQFESAMSDKLSKGISGVSGSINEAARRIGDPLNKEAQSKEEQKQRKIASALESAFGIDKNVAYEMVKGISNTSDDLKDIIARRKAEAAAEKEYAKNPHAPKPYKDLFEQAKSGDMRFLNNESAKLTNKESVSADALRNAGYKVGADTEYGICPQTRLIGEDGSKGLVLSPILKNGEIIDSNTLNSMIRNIMIDGNGNMKLPEGMFKHKLEDILVSSYDLPSMSEKERLSYMSGVKSVLETYDNDQYGRYAERVKADRERRKNKASGDKRRTVSQDLDRYANSDLYRTIMRITDIL